MPMRSHLGSPPVVGTGRRASDERSGRNLEVERRVMCGLEFGLATPATSRLLAPVAVASTGPGAIYFSKTTRFARPAERAVSQI